MDITSYIGKAIAYYRAQKEWTTVQLANEANVSQGSISLYENGKRNPSEEALGKIADALGISISTITERAENIARNEQAHLKESPANYTAPESEYEKLRQIERIYRFNDFVFHLNNDVIVSINTRVHDLIEMVEYSNRAPMGSRNPLSIRRDHTSLIAHLTEKVFADFIREHIDEISYRFEDELSRLQMDAYQLIDELRIRNNK